MNHLHGGVSGFDKRIWNVKSATNDTLTLSLFSPDGDEGYPGNMCIEVTYHLTGSALSIDYHAVSDSDTVCNLTNHAYFNLAGHDSGSIAGHTIQIFADRYTPTDQFSIPTGEIQTVAGTHMDLREPTVIADHVDSDDEQLRWAGGYDHNCCINGETGQLRLAAVASSPDTGIVMETYTTQPGLQFYIGNYLDGCPNGKNGAVYGKHSGFCLETQRYPDSPNHAAFPDSLLRPGEEYHHITVYSFR